MVVDGNVRKEWCIKCHHSLEVMLVDDKKQSAGRWRSERDPIVRESRVREGREEQVREKRGGDGRERERERDRKKRKR